MNKKTIVYIRTNGIYSDSRATKEIRNLSDAGYRVIILGWDRNGGAKSKCKEVFAKLCNAEFLFFSIKLPNGIGFKQIDKLLKWFFWVNKRLTELSHVDAIHCCDLDGALGAYIYCRKNNVPMVYDIYDYYIDSHRLPKLVEKIVEKVDIRVINEAAFVIICTEERKEQIKKSTPNKVIVMHNSPDINRIENHRTVYDYVYCGGLDDIRLVGEIFDKYKDYSHFKFCIAGFGPRSGQAQKLSTKYNNFTFKGTIAYDEVIKIEEKAICLSAIYDPSFRNHKLCAPNKFYEALALGKPVIVCRGTGIDRIVEENKVGIVINYDATEFYRTIRFLKDTPGKCKEMGQKGRELYETQYRWEIMKDRMLSAYSTLWKSTMLTTDKQ